MPLDFACPDWEEKLRLGRVPIPDFEVDKEAADQAVGLFNSLRLPDVPGQPTFGEAGGAWFPEIIRPLFGTSNKETGERQIGELFLLVPKKNAKTTNAAALGIVWLCLNTTRNLKGLIIGPTQDVADTCFSQAQGMIEADPDLVKLFKVQEHLKKITHRITKSVLSIKTFDMRVVTGTIPAFVVLDELHILAKSSYASKVIGQIRGGMITNPQSLLIIITTQSVDPPVGAFKTELQYARSVRDGKIKDHVNTLVVLYEFSEKMQTDDSKLWRDPKYWPMVLPNLGRSITLPRLEILYEKARQKGIEEEILWASQHLNIEIGLALHSERWKGADIWQSCKDEDLTLDEIIDRSEVITVGFDGGGLDDLAGLAVIGRCKVSRSWLVWCHAWVQRAVLDEKRKQIASQLDDFEVDEDLTICEASDPNRDFREVTEIIVKIKDANLLPEESAIGLDTYGVADLVDMLFLAGLTEDQVVGVPQGYKLSGAIWGIERKLSTKTLLHNGSAMMAWVVGNAKAEMRGNNIYITKSAAGKAKIDPLTALFNAYQLMAKNPEVQMKNLDDFLSNPVMVA